MRSEHSTAARAGFTLIELLVVVSIISLLVGLLLPALNAARQAAQGAVCLSQQRQMSIGWSIYADSNRDILVPGQAGRYGDESFNVYWVGNGWQYRPRWYVMMGAAAGFYALGEPSPDREFEHSAQVTNEVFLCPSASKWTSTRNSCYGYNYQYLGNARFIGDDETLGFVNYPVLRERVIDQSGTVMCADSLGTAAGKPASMRTPNQPDGSRHPDGLAVGGHGYSLDPPRLTATSDFADTRLSAPKHRSGPDERHRGRANVTFCDGHVEAMTATELGYHKNGDGSIAFNGEDTTNALFSGARRDDDPPKAL